MRRLLFLVAAWEVAQAEANKCVGLSHFTSHGVDTSALPLLNIFNTGAWAEHLRRDYKVSPGPQTNKSTDLCLITQDTQVVLPTCLEEAGFRWVIFVGDSLTRELAWSFVRHAASSTADDCHLLPTLQSVKPLENGEERPVGGKHDPSFQCDRQQVGALCPAQFQSFINKVPTQECCGKFWSLYLYAEHSDIDHRTLDTVREINATCNCPGLVVANVGVHSLLEVKDKYSFNPEPWEYPFGRIAGVSRLFAEFKTMATRAKLYWASTVRIDETQLMLAPRRDIWRNFGQLAFTKQWAAIDRNLTGKHNVGYLPQYELSVRFKGLQVDALHFGSYGGFSSVTDVLTQILLHHACFGERVDICG